MIKKTLFLCLAWVLSIGCPLSGSVSAADVSYMEEARVFYDLGLYKGVSADHFDPDLFSFSDKETALVFLLRLAGQRDNVQASSDSGANYTLGAYTDGSSVSDWARKHVAYGLRQKLIPDISNNQILPKRLCDGKTFTAILLRIMGYSLDNDLWEISTYINSYIGGMTADDAREYADKILTKNDMIAIVWKSLYIKDKNGTSFLSRIVADNGLQKSRMTALGFTYSSSGITAPAFRKTAVNLDNVQNNRYSMQDGSAYYGETSGGVPNGRGVVYYADGSKYEGSVVGGMRHGEGKLTRNDGFVYSGSWENDKMTGYATLKWPSGDSYTGNLYTGYFQGYGTMVWASGDSYTGNWREGKFSGQGTFRWANGNYYQGDWSDGEFDGYGVLNILNSGIYEGQWRMGKKNGRGKFVSVGSTVQEGTWENDNYVGP